MTESGENPALERTAAGVGVGGFLQGYAGRAGASDEMVDADGALRPQWESFVRRMDELGPSELRRRWDQARGLIQENGITHNVYGDADGLERPWSLDFIPLLIPAARWDSVSDGLLQRARLLDRLLADLYGPARSVSSGVLPPDLVYGNPGFLRPCHGIVPPLGRWLHLYGADLVGTPAGGFEVLSDRTQGPSGAGYTLENRLVMSRTLPSVFGPCNVLRLAPFFADLRRGLAGLTPREAPVVVLLTPGPYNETYFEHVYLARYLGYTLVQGNDLTVRDARVFLKTLSGLQPVDVILRRVDDDFCDPLELYPDSFLGVPGLVEAVREGNVAVANALGSGVLQAPGFLPFLPALCRSLLGEELRLPSVATWWCGDSASLSHVLENLSRMVIKPSLPTSGADPVFGPELTAQGLSDLAARLRSRPGEFVAQEEAEARTSPTLTEGGLHPRRFVVRAFLASSGESYTSMPGGLTWVPRSADSLVVSLQKGGGSKDTWVVTDGPVKEASLLPSPTQPLILNRSGGDLPSRVADDLFWLGRYVQRADAAVRVGRSALGRAQGVQPGWTGSAVGALLRSWKGLNADGPLEQTIVAALLEPMGGSGLRTAAAALHRLARLSRERISVDAWRLLQGIERDLARFRVDPAEPSLGIAALLDGLVVRFAAFDRMTIDSMTRGQAWRFLDLGHRIERAMAVARVLRDTLVDVVEDDPMLFEALLEITDSSLTYRRRYFTRLEPCALVDLLLADESNPRAVAYQVAEIERHLESLPHEWAHPRQGVDRQRALKLRTSLQTADLQAACAASGGRRVALEGLLARTWDQLAQLAESVGQIYFTHATLQQGLKDRGARPGP